MEKRGSYYLVSLKNAENYHQKIVNTIFAEEYEYMFLKNLVIKAGKLKKERYLYFM